MAHLVRWGFPRTIVTRSRVAGVHARSIFSTTPRWATQTYESTVPVPIEDTESAAVEALQQAPNRETAWSETQQPRAKAMTSVDFLQKDLSAQPRPMAAIELIAEEPVRMVEGRKAVCDGGGGPLGHPKVYINLDQDKVPHACGYCKYTVYGV
ncbi:hypothetical protein IWQ62_002818 [Dispira parvispora]|uniref:Zinc finger CHCC-type domain-containing protein n=1 Tax=Dispira parvispora TaxID=1520584 RepID=A0A9W8AVZ6_9FUNG|nr:hypothetical protein IWQ62_002818 [Dispira parvispora]